MEDNKNMTTPESEVKEENKTYSTEEVQKMIEEGRKQALEEANRKADERFQNKLKESEKLARMSEQEKFQYELEQREKAIEAKEKELALLDNKNAASKILAEKGISLALVDFVVAEDADTMKTNIDVLERAFKESVKNEVEKRLASNTPKKNLPRDNVIDRQAFLKMGVSELMELKQNNPQLYETLRNNF